MAALKISSRQASPTDQKTRGERRPQTARLPSPFKVTPPMNKRQLIDGIRVLIVPRANLQWLRAHQRRAASTPRVTATTVAINRYADI